MRGAASVMDMRILLGTSPGSRMQLLHDRLASHAAGARNATPLLKPRSSAVDISKRMPA